MGCVIVLFVIALVFAAIAGVAFGDDKLGTGVGIFIISIIVVVVGAVLMINHYDGDIGSVYNLDSASIYHTYGRLETEKGAVLILSNGEQDIRAIWVGETGCPENEPYVRVVDGKKLVSTETATSKSPAQTATTQPKSNYR